MSIRRIVAICGIASLVGACGSDDQTGSTSSSLSSSSQVNSSSSSVSSEAPASLVINEIVAKSADPSFVGGNDWIELVNLGQTAINLSEIALADDAAELFQLPEGVLEAGGYVVVAAVDSEDFPIVNYLSVPFKLGKADSVNLYWQGQLLDSVRWDDGNAPEGQSWGVLDGSLQSLLPTPGLVNQPYIAEEQEFVPRGNPTGNSPLRITEVVAKSDRPNFYDDRDWIELQNTGSTVINLSEFSLADSGSELEGLPNITLQPGEYTIVVSGGDAPNDSTPYVSFGLAGEDSLSLFHFDVEVDYLNWSGEGGKNGRSFGRLDGVDQVLYPTPNQPNVEYKLFSDTEVLQAVVDISEENWQAILSNPQAEEYYPANFELNGAKISNVGFRVKGQGSLNFIENSIRYGFKVDMNEYEDQKFMGMKKLVFNQSFSDPSFMRAVLAYNLMRDAGVPSPQISYVDLWVAGEHLGLYQMIEMIDTEFLERHFAEDDEGDLFKGELGQRLTWTNDSISSYSSGLRQKTNEETLGTPEEGASLIQFLDGINNSDSPLSYIDVDLTIRYLAASVLLGNMDSPIGATANNFYLYEQREKGVFTYLPWDYNLSMGLWGNGPAITIGGFGGFGGGFGGFGGFGGGFGNDSEVAEPVIADCLVLEHVIDNPVHDTNSVRPMLDPILADPTLREQYHETLRELMASSFNPTAMRAEVNRIASLIDPYVQADPTKFFTYDEWRLSLEQGLPDDSDNSAGRGANTYGPAPGILDFIQQRYNIVQQQLNGQLPSSNNGGTACPTPQP